MTNAFRQFFAAREGCPDSRIPRSELWIGTDALVGLGFTDDLRGHIAFRRRWGMDTLMLPMSHDKTYSQSCGYRFFNADEVAEARTLSHVPVGVIVDGPFQRYLAGRDFLAAMAAFAGRENDVAADLAAEAHKRLALVATALRTGAALVIIADDIAWQAGLYLGPEVTHRMLGPLYIDMVSLVRAAGALPLIHSCGAVGPFLPQLCSYGFLGPAGCEVQAAELLRIGRKCGPDYIMLAGIDGNLLETGRLTPAHRSEFQEAVSALAASESFMATSSCGLRSVKNAENLRRLYELLDAVPRPHGAVHQ